MNRICVLGLGGTLQRTYFTKILRWVNGVGNRFAREIGKIAKITVVRASEAILRLYW